MGKGKKKSSERPENWDRTRVGHWLESLGFDKYKTLFCDTHEIDGKALLTITEEDLRGPPLQLTVLGDIKRLSIYIHQLQLKRSSSNGTAEVSYRSVSEAGVQHRNRVMHIAATNRRHCHQNGSESSDGNYASSEASMDEGYGSSKNRELKPEIWKTVVAMLYFITVTWITAIVMVIVNDRVPDMQTYPPLPDIFLDNVPLIPWAFAMCEFTGLVLFLVWALILVMHKHRFILLRRMFSLFGSVFLLRCVTMLITSLSVPGRHLECKARPYGNWWQKLYQACIIWLGGGMSIQGVRTCGDYMFSGHTVALTLLNFFITEYTPRRMYYLHTFTWVLNLFGIFFILAAHEHYSIDVFIAFYISTRLFLYYHTLANNRALMQDDGRRTRIWFPLFYFFESGVMGTVPAEYEWPIKIPLFIKEIFNSS